MAPPEIWGPPVWNFIHTLAEKVNEDYFNVIKTSLFSIIKRICIYLPCPECSQHANYFLMKVNIAKINSKSEFKHMLFVFHNAVNKRKRKPVFNYNIINKYKSMTIPQTYNNFINTYSTKGNLNLIMESFQRSLVVKELQLWLQRNHNYLKPKQIQRPNYASIKLVTDETNTKDDNNNIQEENIKLVISEEEEENQEEENNEEDNLEEENNEEENNEEENQEEDNEIIDEVIEPIIISDIFKIDDYQNEETTEQVVVEPVVEEPLVEETIIEETSEVVVEETVVEETTEQVVVEHVVEETTEQVVVEHVVEETTEQVVVEHVVEETVIEETATEEIQSITENDFEEEKVISITENDFEPISQEEINEEQTSTEIDTNEIIELALQMIKSKAIDV